VELVNRGVTATFFNLGATSVVEEFLLFCLFVYFAKTRCEGVVGVKVFFITGSEVEWGGLA
jgi:hypothetical protein